MSDLKDSLINAPGYCQRCGLIKPLGMIAMPGLYEDENGEIAGESAAFSLDPLKRRGYCVPCTIEVLKEMQRKN